VLGQIGDVLQAFAQRRQQDLEDIEPVVEVLAQLAVADIDMIGGQIQDAFDRLLDFVAAGHKADIEPVRQRLLEYFTIPEPTDERLKRARRRLATLMY
jgi:putative thioredoxin